jgi:hypothetical protein
VNALTTPITLDGSTVDEVVVTLSNRPPRLMGTVRGPSSGDPASLVIVFPADTRNWIDAGMSNRLVRTVDVRPTGAFEITGLIPGNYAVIAVPAGAAVDTRDPQTMELLSTRATRVTLAVGETKAQALTVSQVR